MNKYKLHIYLKYTTYFIIITSFVILFLNYNKKIHKAYAEEIVLKADCKKEIICSSLDENVALVYDKRLQKDNSKQCLLYLDKDNIKEYHFYIKGVSKGKTSIICKRGSRKRIYDVFVDESKNIIVQDSINWIK